MVQEGAGGDTVTGNRLAKVLTLDRYLFRVLISIQLYAGIPLKEEQADQKKYKRYSWITLIAPGSRTSNHALY